MKLPLYLLTTKKNVLLFVSFIVSLKAFMQLYFRGYMHIKCYIWSMALYGAETWMLRAADQKYLESFEMWCSRRMEKISWTDHVRNEEVLLRVNEQRNILREIRKWKANWIGHILRRNCLLKHVIEGKIKREMEVTRRWGRRRKKLLDDLDRILSFEGGSSRSHYVEESFWRRFWTCRQTEYWMNEWICICFYCIWHTISLQ